MPPELLRTYKTNKSSECLFHCKEGTFSIALLSFIESSFVFECICIKSETYKFRMQDITYDCHQPHSTWCPDLDGPCSIKKDLDVLDPHMVVYTLEDVDDKELILPNDEVNICNFSQIKTDPNVGMDECSATYFLCVKSDATGRAIWTLQTCPQGQIFSKNESRCTSLCNQTPEPRQFMQR